MMTMRRTRGETKDKNFDRRYVMRNPNEETIFYLEVAHVSFRYLFKAEIMSIEFFSFS